MKLQFYFINVGTEMSLIELWYHYLAWIGVIILVIKRQLNVVGASFNVTVLIEECDSVHSVENEFLVGRYGLPESTVWIWQ